MNLSALGIVGMASTNLVSAMGKKPNKKQSEPGFTLGVASYSLRKFTLEQALLMTRSLGINRISLKDFHLPMNSTKEEIAAAVALCKKHEVDLYGGGVIYMKSKEEADHAFEYAKAAGMKMIIGVPNHELLGYVEEKTLAYDIALAIHNHGPGDKLYPSAESAYVLIKDMDKRMGLCIDIGHTKRINREPEQDLKDFSDRVLDIHIKDVTAAEADGTTCEIGRGVIDIPSFLQTVIKLKYNGTLSFEYEKDGDDPLAGMAESVGYVRGVLVMNGIRV
jgi:sugar phosphate isomerase/epimerase